MKSSLILSVVVSSALNPLAASLVASAGETPAEPIDLVGTLHKNGSESENESEVDAHEQDGFDSQHGGRCAEGKCGGGKKYGKREVDAQGSGGRVACAIDATCGISGQGIGVRADTKAQRTAVGEVRPGTCGNSAGPQQAK